MKTKHLTVLLFVLGFIPITCVIYVWLGMNGMNLKDFPGGEDAAWGSSIGWLVLLSLVGWTTLPQKKLESRFTLEQEDLLLVLGSWKKRHLNKGGKKIYGTAPLTRLPETQTWAKDAEAIAASLGMILPVQFLKYIEPLAKKQASGSHLHVVSNTMDAISVA